MARRGGEHGATARDARARPLEGERLSGAIYGTVVVASVLAVSAEDRTPSAAQAAGYVLSTIVVLWIAHAWADIVASPGLLRPGQRARVVGRALARHWAVVQSVVPPLVVVGIAALLGASDEVAIASGIWMCVVALASWGGGIAWRETRSWPWTAAFAAAAGAIGLLVALLKAVVH